MKLPLLSGRRVLRALVRHGFVELNRKGSHVKMKHEDCRLTSKGALQDAEIDLEYIVLAVK